ncbi:MAG: exo-alpha-sialidase, partial [Methylococcales bacterium]|nr:exo-alpha-sialidase [Methylococcales bacterium]
MKRRRFFPLALSQVLVMLSDFARSADLQFDKRATPMPTQMLGPFVNIGNGQILAIDSASTFVSSDGGKTWSDPRPVFSADKKIKISNERAMFRTKDGTIIAAFMNLNERKWTWKDELIDAPGAVLPTYVMRSLDDGKTWQDIQKMHDDWSGAVRDMIQTKDGRIIFTAMKMRHDPGRHAVLTYSSVDDGKTWKASNLIDLGGTGNHGGVTEPTLTELKSGRIWMLIRTNWSEFWSAYSDDG